MTDSWVTQGESYSIIPDWKPGQTTTYSLIACCPHCGAVDVAHRGVKGDGRSLVYYECVKCRKGWKLTEHKVSRAIVIR